MDGLSAAANVIAIVELSAKIYSLCQEYYVGVKNTRRDIQRLSNEVLALHEILEKLAELVNSANASKFATLALLDKKDGPADQCAQQLKNIITKLEPNEDMKRLGWRALKWPLKSEKVNEFVTIIERHKSTFTLALGTDQAYAMFLHLDLLAC